MRKVKDAKDLSSNELIYFKGHAKATYMSDGTTVEDAINNIEVGTSVDLSDYATKEELNSKQNTITDLEVIRQGAAKGATSIQQGTLSTVATSGSYNDLTNKPTIPNAVSESTVSDWGFTKHAGTVTGVKINGSTKNPSNGVVDLGTVITFHQDISGKQDKLVSGANIKTINGTSILGSGDITISGGSSNSSSAYPLVEIKTISGAPDGGGLDSGSVTINPNTFYVLRGNDAIGSTGCIEIILGEETPDVANEYLFLFTSGSTATELTLSDNIKWTNEPNIGTNKIYLISILNGLGTILEFDV